MISASSEAVTLADRIDAVLPQTQCRRCGFAGCRPYADAIAAGEADINRCPPGGERGIERLAQLRGVAAKPLNPECGSPTSPAVAVIDEDRCIGCALCLPACPVDAILGARKHLHTVIAAYCTGCELCLPPCPVDCITLVPTGDGHAGDDAVRLAFADAARERHRLHLARREHEAPSFAAPGSRASLEREVDPKRAAVQAAIERAKARAAAAQAQQVAPTDTPRP
ncbi:MAG: RnfABCDGE type electron transport complex subunit B [Burkholderiales bacterium]